MGQHRHRCPGTPGPEGARQGRAGHRRVISHASAFLSSHPRHHERTAMKIGILGAGNIGSTLAERLSTAGHKVSIANSRDPKTVDPAALSTGATAVWAADVPAGADVVIVSIGFGQIPAVATLVSQAPAGATIIDTSNYFPHRDGRIEAIENGQVESLWVQEHFQRPVVKAWNAITTRSFDDKASRPGSPGRIALPVAADDDTQRATAMALVDETGFDAFDAGVLADSWRQQPGTPAYTTDLTIDQLPAALAKADARRSPRRRDLMMEIIADRIEAEGELDHDRLITMVRALF
ncbi:NAD(P)-binding domain-containing protein [Streptomyces griseoloalbus]|uniref:NADPH-dependent F420 reductase n=1 Tax=Streptomyces griseoloalbus TaxID=67303 RepID=UPI0033B3F9AB